MRSGGSGAFRQAARHRLLLRDGLTFLSLTAVTLVLGAVTTLLFRSFESRREELAVRWAERGRAALQRGDALSAASAFRVSLGYRRDDEATQMALAEALARGNHVDEAENYFLNLWQAQPGNGPINLQLARLERSRGNEQAATDYYRAAVFGTWSGDAPAQRRDIRLELSRYLVERGQMQAAQAELLIAAGNNPSADAQIAIGRELEAAGNPQGALSAYHRAEKEAPYAHTAAAYAGELCYRLGGYACADAELTKAMRFGGWTGEQKLRLADMQHEAESLQDLDFGPALSPGERVRHLLEAAHLAKNRLSLCPAASTSTTGAAPAQTLAQRWKELDTGTNRAALRHDSDLQETFGELIYQTETAAAAACGAPSGDDARLLYLQRQPMTNFGVQQQ